MDISTRIGQRPRMQTSLLTAVVMPIALGIIMLGLGLGLTVDDFKRVARILRAVGIGLACQMLLLPAVAWGIAKGLSLPPELAVGLMLLSASPGGATANLFSHLAKGDVALNLTLTATNSVLSLLTLPVILNLAMLGFMGVDKQIPFQFAKIAQVFAIVLLPVGLGMLLKAKKPALAAGADKPVKIFSAIFLLLLIVGAVLQERTRLSAYAQSVGLAALLFNLLSLGVGYLLPRLLRLSRKQSIAIGMEIGIHNGTLAIAIASSPLLLNNMTVAMPAAIYSLIMFFTAGAFGWLMTRLPEDAAAALAPATPAV